MPEPNLHFRAARLRTESPEVPGEPREAAQIGVAALDAAGKIHSRRVADEVRELGRCATKHRHINEVARLRQRIDLIARPA